MHALSTVVNFIVKEYLYDVSARELFGFLSQEELISLSQNDVGIFDLAKKIIERMSLKCNDRFTYIGHIEEFSRSAQNTEISLDEGDLRCRVSLGKNGSSQFDCLLREMDISEVKRVILDLRGNGGGLVDETLKLSKYFLTTSTEFFYFENRNGRRSNISTRQLIPGRLSGFPLRILIDRRTASMAEVMAGCLRRNNDDVIVCGENSLGKNILQSEFVMPSQSLILLLSADRWFFPDGKSVGDVGITPDI
ncbi:S41 family peptidase [Patescibacteria group bacterium]